MRLVETGGFGGSSRNQVTIVFDGQVGISFPKKTLGVKVVFSSGEIADDLIKRLIGKEVNKKNVYAVTDDRALGQSVKDLGAKVLSVKDFLGKTKERNKKVLEEKRISSTAEFKINDELKKAWLK